MASPGLKSETPFLYVVLDRTACFQVRRFTSDCEPYEDPSSMKLISRTQSAGRLSDAMSRGFCTPGRGMPLTAYAAPFCTERRMECAEPTKLRRKSGTWGTHRLQELVPDDSRGLARTYVLSLHQTSLILPEISYYDARQLPAFVEFRRNSPFQCGQTAGAPLVDCSSETCRVRTMAWGLCHDWDGI